MLLIGAGNMAKEYIKVLNHLEVEFTVIGRSEAGSQALAQETGALVVSGGFQAYLDSDVQIPQVAIVAVPVEQLTACSLALLEAGAKQILVEKPAGLTLDQINQLRDSAERCGGQILVAYNRRYFSSVMALKEHIAQDGGVTSFHFEFTEWAHVIEKLDKPDQVLQKWLLANSTHVIDLAFYLGGNPQQLNCYQGAPLEWHQAGGNFAGSGVSENNALFTYMANWGSAGRWSLEVMTARGRYKLCPLEQLQFQLKGTVVYNQIKIDSALDESYKPGLHTMVEDFISERSVLPNIAQQATLTEQFYQIAGYSPQ
jgi:predicted dehydrogenase